MTMMGGDDGFWIDDTDSCGIAMARSFFLSPTVSKKVYTYYLSIIASATTLCSLIFTIFEKTISVAN